MNHIGGTHELLHILGLAHVQNRADRCNYIDVNTELIQVKKIREGKGWGVEGFNLGLDIGRYIKEIFFMA